MAGYDLLRNARDLHHLRLLTSRNHSLHVESNTLVNGEIVAISDKTVHLGHTICTKDREDITLATKNNFWKQFNMFIANLFI